MRDDKIFYFNNRTNESSYDPESEFLQLLEDLEAARQTVEIAKETQRLAAEKAFKVFLVEKKEISATSVFTLCQKICEHLEFWQLIPEPNRQLIFYKHVNSLSSNILVLKKEMKIKELTDQLKEKDKQLEAFRKTSDVAKEPKIENFIESVQGSSSDSLIVKEPQMIQDRQLRVQVMKIATLIKKKSKTNYKTKSRENRLKINLKSKSVKTLRICPHCGKSFNSIKLNSHIIRRHFEKIQCEIENCASHFCDKSGYGRHLISAHKQSHPEEAKMRFDKLQNMKPDHTQLKYVQM